MSETTENIKLQLKRGEKGSFDIKNCSAVLAYGEPFGIRTIKIYILVMGKHL